MCRVLDAIMVDDKVVPVVWISAGTVAEAREFAERRVRQNEARGWKSRYEGQSAVDAHAAGELGELGVGVWLTGEGIEFQRADPLVDEYRLIQQDLVILGRTVGVKTAMIQGIADMTRYPNLLYPDKSHASEASRVLGYPDALIQTFIIFEPRQAIVYIYGWVPRAWIERAPSSSLHGRHAHRIPLRDYLPCAILAERIARAAARESDAARSGESETS